MLSHVQLFSTPWTAECQASLSFTISWSLLKFTSIELVIPSNQLILCRPLLLLPSIFPRIRVFSNETVIQRKSSSSTHTHTHTHTQSLSVVPGRGLKSHPTQTKGRALRVLHSQYVLLCKTILLPSWWEMRLLSYRSKSTSCAGPVLLMWTMDSQLQHTWNTCFLPLNTSCDPVRALVAQTVKNLPATLETWVRFLGQEDRLEEGMAPHSSILAWRIPWTEEPGGPQSMGWQRIRHD